MKKLLALVLALVMVLSLAVSAFAVVLEPVKADKDDPVINFNKENIWYDIAKDEELYLIFGEGGVYYTPLAIKDKTIKTAEVSVDNDFVTAEVVDYDPETMVGGWRFGISYKLSSKNTPEATTADMVGFYNEKAKKETGFKEIKPVVDDDEDPIYKYEDLVTVADFINKIAKTKDTTVKQVGEGKILKLTVADNYTVDYKEATITIKATSTTKGDKKTYTNKINVISDVAIYEHNTILWAAEDEEPLTISAFKGGYSAYATQGNYKDTETYDEWENRYTFTTSVLPTTGFRAIAGKEIVLETNRPGINATVTIPEVAAGQKGVNFAFVTDGEAFGTLKKDLKSFSFGFKGQQVIASDYTIDVDLGCTYYELRQAFRAKLEEEDVLKFYILKDGKAFDELVVDFMTVDDTENVEFTIEGKAGTNLGYYTMTLTAPAAEEGETNPDTGAESMIGVVAAMAVITLASAAAISLKK